MMGRRTVLVVDDDPGILHVLSSGLSRALEGFEIMTASNGREAVDLMAQSPPNVLVTDLAMPVMDGFALISHVTHHRPTLPVVVLTVMAPANTDPQLASFGSLRVLRKPASYQAVAQAVLAELERVERGEPEGIALAGVLQLVESERRNCTVVVRSGKRRGQLHFESGRLVNAFSDDFGAEGEAAAFDILGWSHTAIDLEPLPPQVRHLIQTPLQRLLADVAAVAAPAITAPAATAPPATESAQADTVVAEVDTGPEEVPGAPEQDASAMVDAEPDTIEIPTAEAEADAVDAPLTVAETIELTFGEPDGSAAAPGDAPAIDPPPGEAEAPEIDRPEPHATGAALDTEADAVVATPAVPPSAVISAGVGDGAATGVTEADDGDHVAAMVTAIERLAHRAREADEALAAVAAEVETFRETRRQFDEVTALRERRRQELEALRVDVGHLAREILGRVDSLFDAMQSDSMPSGAPQEPPPT